MKVRQAMAKKDMGDKEENALNENASFDKMNKRIIAEIKGVSFRYAQDGSSLSCLNNVSLQLREGECVLLTGLSGCGKTTITRLINGLIPHYYEGVMSGSVVLEDKDVSQLPIYQISSNVATVFQNPKSQFFNLDTTSEIVFFLENMGFPFEKMHERLTFVSKFLNIEHLLDRNIFNLSGGQKQMIAIASALASDANIIVFDEMTSNLDLHYIEKIAQALKLLKEEGKTLLISEHRLYFLKDIIDRAVIMKDGKVEHVFTRNEFLSLSDEQRKKLLLRPINIDDSIFEKTIDSEVCASKQVASACAESKNKELVIKELVYRYPNVHEDFLNCKNITMQFGKVIALVGKNGQGKTTFAQCLIGLIKARKDCVLLDGKKQSAKARLSSSYLVMQDVGYQLFTESVVEEVELGKNKIRKKKELQENSSSPATEEILQFMNLSDLKERHPLSLSGGQKQRVSIACAISADANIIIMDEPTSGMDYFHMKETASIINKLLTPEKLIIIISHDVEFLSYVADEIMVMEKGEIILHSPFTSSEACKIFEYLKE